MAASPLTDTRALALDAQGLERLKQQAGRDPGRAVGEASQQFEALLLNMMLKSMRQAGGQDGMFDTEQSKLYT
ncbi:MAG TPA: flagellar assembly peptidoglycan hydrolase FlgJ, partial [Burkholderiales bacterium]|nr:flagellar assembly peptidoglycan hydrolase FlgJ [Burkholderiales bacterium]